MRPEPIFVVYQMGKVASTSIVNSLSAIPGAKAFQSHFLTGDALKQAADRLIDSEMSNYGYQHLSRQFLRNLDLFRLLKRAKNGEFVRKQVFIISLARNPVEWARSYIVQDMVDFEPQFLRLYYLNHNEPLPSKEAGVEFALNRIVSTVGRFYEKAGGVLNAEKLSFSDRKDLADTISPEEIRIINRFEEFFRRPHTWFQTFLEPFVGMTLQELNEIEPHIYFNEKDDFSTYVMRYEDLRSHFSKLTALMGYPEVSELSKDNTSESKLHAEVVTKVFSENRSVDIIKYHSQTDYTRFFKYEMAPVHA